MHTIKLSLVVAFIANAFLLTAQNVGIGVEHPGSKLSVAGGISIGENYASKAAPDGTILIEKSMGIGTDTIDPNVVLDIRSTTKGVLFPTMNTQKRNSIINPPKGLFVFNEDSSGFNFYNGASWLNFALLGPTGPIGAAASLLGLGANNSVGGYAATSVSLSTVSTGTKVLVTQLGLSYRANDRVRISAASNKYMEGIVTSYTAGVLTVNVDRVVGSGSSLSWAIGLAGDVGATGPAGTAGAQGPQGIQGIQGAAGAQGPAGAAGINGATWFTGAGVPANGTGSVNDFYLNSSNGTYYKKTGGSTWTSQGSLRGVTGATGAAGPQGSVGAVGPQGPAGAQGPQGPAGVAGSNGTVGPQGIQGLKGATGATGATGANGAVGPQGPAGAQGVAGAAGPQGPAGAAGAQGIQGIKGATGATGANGTNGAAGPQGPAGVAGANGTNGTNGATWLNGTGVPASGVGVVNDFYLDASNGTFYKKTGASTWTSQGSLRGVTGATGANGAVGAQGPAGAVGPQGPAGAAGAQGAQGIQGIKGATGATGANGTNGAAGPQGPAGVAGSNGTLWHTGAAAPASGLGSVNDLFLNSSNGTYYKKTGASTWTSQGSLKGATGAAGAQGPAGAAGVQGLKGATGATGANGTNGAAGSNGTLWHTGNAAPGNGVGAVNDLFLNSSNGTYYKKTNATTWASQGSLKGPAGSLANGSAAGNTPYWNGSSWIVNNSNIFNNGANVGIGTTSPGHKFEVMNGNISIDNSNNTAGSLVMYEPSNSGTNFTAFKARAQAADITYNLPASQTANTMLLNDGNGNLTWSPVNQQVISMFERKNSNQSTTSSNFTDDNDFTYTLEPNQSYEISGLIRISAHKDGEWKMQFAGPSGCQTLISMAYNTEYLDEMIWITAPNTTYYMLDEGADPNADVVFVNGIVTTGSTGGSFKFKWAQKNSNSNATTIYANSYIRLTRVQ